MKYNELPSCLEFLKERAENIGKPSYLQKLIQLVSLADSILLLQHEELSDVEMNTLTIRQYMIWQNAKKELMEEYSPRMTKSEDK